MDKLKKPSPGPVTRKPYNKPELQVYGNLLEMTNKVAHNSPHLDPGTYPNNRTH